MVFRLSEIGKLPYVYHPAAISGNSKKTLWWNFIDNESNPGFEQWYSNEFDYLNSFGVFPEKISQKNYRLLWQRKQAVLKTEEQLILVYPDTVNGQSVNAHPLWGDLQACFGKSIDTISFNPEKNLNENLLNNTLSLPDQEKTIVQDLKKAGHFINITQDLGKIEPRETETFSGLDNLIYYPYQWAFRYLLGLHKSSILSIVRQETLKGNLAHSAFEKIFKETIEKNSTWTKDAVYQWMEKEIPLLIEREAAVLMMYGQEAERRAFINMMKHAAWTLISSIQNNGWQISGTEVPISGKLGNQDLKGKADLILEKDGQKAVIDLKFSGNDRYSKKIKNREDIQLLIYSRFTAEPENWAHTAYYIISSAKLFAKNNDAFAEAEALLPDEALKAVNDSIWEKLQNTYEWRISQLSEGLIEIRNQKNIQALTEAYEGLNMLDMLELPTQDAFYDIYGVLVGSGIKD
jgi:ATP-dependent helicase/nuclease subunit B